MWNGGEFYGPRPANSLVLLNQYFSQYPSDAAKIILNIKGGAEANLLPNGSAKHLRESIEEDLRQLGPVGKIDMYECARRDANVPLRESLGTLAELVEEGKIGGVALSEVSAATIREAVTITKIAAVEIELSLFSTEALSNGVVAACVEHQIPILAYSPIGRGMLTGQVRKFEDLPEDDVRRGFPRFQPENFGNNIRLVEEVERLAAGKGCTAGQVAIGWVSQLSERYGVPIIPIPGATTVERVRENAGAKDVRLTEDELREIDEILEKFETKGDRYPAHTQKYNDG